MNSIVYLIRAQDRREDGAFGWSDSPAIYGDVILGKEAAIVLADKLATERKGRIVAVYECKIIHKPQ